jgi:hypothetical protein
MIKRKNIIHARRHGIKISNLIRNINHTIDDESDKKSVVEVDNRLHEENTIVFQKVNFQLTFHYY